MNLRGFPRRTLRADRAVYRIHRVKHGPWYFSADGSGRFDPVGTGQGACYVAERPLGSWVEVFRKTMLIAEAAVEERALMQTALGRDVRLADLTSRRALTCGTTASLGANELYADSQAFRYHPSSSKNRDRRPRYRAKDFSTTFSSGIARLRS